MSTLGRTVDSGLIAAASCTNAPIAAGSRPAAYGRIRSCIRRRTKGGNDSIRRVRPLTSEFWYLNKES